MNSPLLFRFGFCAVSPASFKTKMVSHKPSTKRFTKVQPGNTYGMYCILYSSSSIERISSGSWPETLMAYTPAT